MFAKKRARFNFSIRFLRRDEWTEEGAKDTGKGMLRLSVNVAPDRYTIHVKEESFNPEGTHTVDAFVGSERAASLSSSPLFAVTLTSLSNAGHIGRGAKQNALF